MDVKELRCKKIFTFLGVFIMFILNACHQDYLSVYSEFSKAVESGDSSIVFFHYLKAGQPPKGISRFPDGGKLNVIYENTSIYLYQKQSKQLIQLHNFEDLPSLSAWTEKISLQNNTLVFSISPVCGWDMALEKFTSSFKYLEFYKKHAGFYVYTLSNNKLNFIKKIKNKGYNPVLSPDGNSFIYLQNDSLGQTLWHCLLENENQKMLKNLKTNSSFTPYGWKNNHEILYRDQKETLSINLLTNEERVCKNTSIEKEKTISIKELKTIISDVPFNQWGFSLNQHWNKSQKKYVDDIVKLNGNFNYRKAVLEEIGNKLTKEDLREILQGMEDYMNSLKGYKKKEYEIFSEETIELLKHYIAK